MTDVQAMGCAVDSDAAMLYFVDQANPSIQRVSYQGTNLTVVKNLTREDQTLVPVGIDVVPGAVVNDFNPDRLALDASMHVHVQKRRHCTQSCTLTHTHKHMTTHSRVDTRTHTVRVSFL